MYYTTELCSLNFAVIKILPPIYQDSKESMANREDKRLLKRETFKNASLKPVTCSFHGCGSLTSKEA